MLLLNIVNLLSLSVSNVGRYKIRFGVISTQITEHFERQELYGLYGDALKLRSPLKVSISQNIEEQIFCVDAISVTCRDTIRPTLKIG